MSVSTLRRTAAASAVSAFALGLAACGGDEPTDGGTGEPEAAANLSPQEALAASVERPAGESYKMESSVTLNGHDFMTFTEIFEGDLHQTSSEMLWSVVPEATGLTDEEAAYMGDFFTDTRTETFTTEDTIYFRFDNEHSEAIAEEYGEDAWFTVDLTDGSDFSEAYAQSGGVDLSEQTDQVVSALTDVAETADGVYTGTLAPDSAIMQELAGSAGADAGAPTEPTQATVELDEHGLLKKMELVLPESDGLAMTLVSEVTETGGEYGLTAPDSTNLHDYEAYLDWVAGL